MSERADQEELTLMLARAFDQAWERYYLPGRVATISEGIAGPSLARHLVAMVKEGVKEEDALAAGGLLHLISLTPEVRPWGELRIEGAHARFLPQWKIRS
jgi:hypothetical protein